MTAPILVTGGTGTLDKHVVPALLTVGRAVRMLTRQTREAQERLEFVKGDLSSGEGIEAAVEGAEIVMDCAGSS
jgi:nucleoside-diphosphate-sugar epimerase